MRRTPDLLRKHFAASLGLAACLALFGFARIPELPASQRGQLASRFRFTRVLLPPARSPARSLREVNPSLRHLAAWISAVGAAVAVADLDDDGVSNDLCHVDPRDDTVAVLPVPGTGARFARFTLAALPGDGPTVAPMGCEPRDVNEDGLVDLFVYYWGRPPVAFLRMKPGAPTAASWHPDELFDREERWYTNAATFADLDGDGHLDLLIGNYFADGARILDARAAQPDSMHASMSNAANGGRNRVFRWAGAEALAVRYEEIRGALGETDAHRWTLAIGAADLDGDLLPEVYFANDFGPDVLLHNRSTPGSIQLVPVRGTRRLTTPKSKTLGLDSFKGMGVDFADVDGDGRLDIWVSNITDEYALEESHFLFVSAGSTDTFRAGVAPYEDASEALGVSRSGWGWDTRFGDFDNDGTVEGIQATGFVRGDVNRWPELQELATANDGLLPVAGAWPRFASGTDLSGRESNAFFVRGGDGRFHDLAREVGLGDVQVTRGVATADVDRDGDLDVVFANQWEASALYRNDGVAGPFLGLRLRVPLAGRGASAGAARDAVGARALVHLPDGRKLVAEVDGGNGHSGVRSPELHFGLGPSDTGRAVRVDLHWRDDSGIPHVQTRWLEPGWHDLVLKPSRAGRDDS